MTLSELGKTVETAVTDYSAAIAVAKRSYTEAEELMGAIFEKINDRKTEVETRRKMLQDIVGDRTRPQSTRTLAQIELDEMGAPDLRVGDAERVAFVDKIQQGYNALRDMSSAETTLRDALKAMQREIETCKPSAVRHGQTLSADWFARLESSFAMREDSLNAKG